MKLLPNVHEKLQTPLNVSRDCRVVVGDYQYWHYGCDGFDDRGWGCGYRTCQTLCSWIIQFLEGKSSIKEVPSLPDIQQILVDMEDKPASFKGSKDWIGSFEVHLVLDHLFDIPSKIVHVRSGNDLVDHVEDIYRHFEQKHCPLMMGGDQDASSKGIFGICSSDKEDKYLLVVDPHYYNQKHLLEDVTELHNENWVYWKNIDHFSDSSFYNICMPQVKSQSKNP